MGPKRSRDTLEKLAVQYAQRMALALQDDTADFNKVEMLCRLFLLASYDVLRLEVTEWAATISSWLGIIPKGTTWSAFTAFLRCTDQWFMDFLRDADPAQSGKLDLSAFKQQYVKGMRDNGFVDFLPRAILKLMYAYVKDRDVTVYARAHQLLQFPLRPDCLQDSGREVLAKAVESKFMDLEFKLQSRPVVYDPGQFFQKYLKDYDPWEDFIPRFSNGSARIAPDKNSTFWYDKLSMMPNRSLREFLEQCADEDPCSVRQIYASRFCPVPKDSSKMRGITIEPADRTCLQQGYMRTLRRYIVNHRYLHRRIDFWHPELNVELARLGSIDGSFATIDLSDASDSVLWDQVCADCDNLPLLEALKQTRSPKTEMSDGSVVTLAKFAGMGNALTFPIECLEFCKIVEQGIRDVGGSVSKSRYRVYGDDIIVEREFYGGVVAALERNGFKVNKTKSFNAQYWKFRESCGGEFVDGHDVCPIRLPRGPWKLPSQSNKSPVDYSWVPTYIDIANSCYKRLPSVRLYIIHLIMKSMPRELYPVFTTDGSVGLKSDTATNFHLIRKDHSKESNLYTRLGYRYKLVHGTTKTLSKHVQIPEDVQYEYRLSQMALRSDHVEQVLDVDEILRLKGDQSLSFNNPDLRTILMRGIGSLTNESVDLCSHQRGTVWVVTADPDYYSG